MGRLTPEALLAAADDPSADAKANHICEANFYAGELALQQDKKDDATRPFRLAQTGCPRSFIEWSAANAALKSLDTAH
jgi:lipoprotein NlpI